MENKVSTVEEKLRWFAEQAAEASEKSFAAMRELRKWSNVIVELWLEEGKFVSALKGKNQWRSPESRIFSRRSRLQPICPPIPDESGSRSYDCHLLMELNDLPLDEMEADATAARNEMLAMKTEEEWNQ
jgi:hypothetical protein